MDARVGAGYGRASRPNGAGSEYKSKSEYPYTNGPTELDADVEEEEVWDTEGDEDVFLKMTGHHSYKNSGNRADRGSLAHSSQRGLGETARGLSSLTSPVPDIQGPRPPGVPQTNPYTGGMFKTGPGHKGGSSGSKAGWFGPPPPMMGDITPPAYTLADVPTPDERSLEKAKLTHQSLVGDFKEEFLTGESQDDEDVQSSDFV